MEDFKKENDSAQSPLVAAEVERDETVEEVPLYRKKRIFIPLMVITAAVVFGVLYWYIGLSEFVYTDDAFVDGNRVTISSRYIGRIVEQTVDEGDSVKKGQVLVRLDESDLRAQRDQAVAQLKFAEHSLELAKVNLAKTEMDLRRARIQYKNNIIPKEQYDHSLSAFDAAKAQQSIAASQIETARAQIGVIDTQLGNTVIHSPMDGVVAKRWTLPGDVVQMAQPIFSVYDLEHLWVTANLEETKYERLRVDQKVLITIDTYPGKIFEGRITDLGANTAAQFALIPPNNASGNFTKVTQRIPIKISIVTPGADKSSKSPQLLPGMSAEIKIKVRQQ